MKNAIDEAVSLLEERETKVFTSVSRIYDAFENGLLEEKNSVFLLEGAKLRGSLRLHVTDVNEEGQNTVTFPAVAGIGPDHRRIMCMLAETVAWTLFHGGFCTVAVALSEKATGGGRFFRIKDDDGNVKHSCFTLIDTTGMVQ